MLGALAMLACGATAGGQPATANTTAMPDPATVSVPDVNAKPAPRDRSDPDVQFYFHKTGASFAAALADYQACNGLTADIEIFAPPPPFVPIGTDIIPNNGDASGAVWQMFGLVGVIIVGISHDEDIKDWQRFNMRRCMYYKGYRRYATTETVWTQINKGTPAEVATRLALIASGSTPQTEAVEP
jgi:hypothetical protein